jgi:hypothetical protein
MDVVIMSRGAAALKADFGVRNPEAALKVRFDEYLSDPCISSQYTKNLGISRDVCFILVPKRL